MSNYLQVNYKLLARTDIDLLSKLVIAYILSWQSKGGKCFYDVDNIASIFEVTPEAVQDSIDSLIDKDIYIIEDKKKSLLYCFDSKEKDIKDKASQIFSPQNNVTPNRFLSFIKNLSKKEGQDVTPERVDEYLKELRNLCICRVDGIKFYHPSIADEIISYSLMGNYSQFYPLQPERFNELRERFALTMLNEGQLNNLANDIKQNISNRYGQIFDISDIKTYFNDNLAKLINVLQMKNLLADRVFETLEKHKKVSV